MHNDITSTFMIIKEELWAINEWKNNHQKQTDEHTISPIKKLSAQRNMTCLTFNNAYNIAKIKTPTTAARDARVKKEETKKQKAIDEMTKQTRTQNMKKTLEWGQNPAATMMMTMTKTERRLRRRASRNHDVHKADWRTPETSNNWRR